MLSHTIAEVCILEPLTELSFGWSENSANRCCSLFDECLLEEWEADRYRPRDRETDRCKNRDRDRGRVKKRQTEKDREKPQKTSILKGLFSLLTRTEMVNLILDGLYYSLDQRNKKKFSMQILSFPCNIQPQNYDDIRSNTSLQEIVIF